MHGCRPTRLHGWWSIGRSSNWWRLCRLPFYYSRLSFIDILAHVLHLIFIVLPCCFILRILLLVRMVFILLFPVIVLLLPVRILLLEFLLFFFHC